ncbi:MAG: pyruvate kinase [Phycisphaerae bacterium]|nr:pyruvate kinase [Phycisphaerae bacterium]
MMSAAQLIDIRSKLQLLAASLRREADARRDTWGGSPSRRAARLAWRNLAHYLALRRHDLRDLQRALMPWGLSSIGRCESRVMPSIAALLAAVDRILQSESEAVGIAGADSKAAGDLGGSAPAPWPSPRSFFRGERGLARNTRTVFGGGNGGRGVRVMVTLPESCATDRDVAIALIAAGMDCARINCAHGDAAQWRAMAAYVRRAAVKVRRPCKILMDLGGPRVRTALLQAAEDRPLVRGDALRLCEVMPAGSGASAIPLMQIIPAGWLKMVAPGSTVCIDEGKLRVEVVGVDAGGADTIVIETPPDGRRLRPEKGVNFPGTRLPLGPLTDKDLEDLDVVAQEADLVGYSFVHDVADVQRLDQELHRRGARERVGIVLKIETERALQNLPDLIMASMALRPTAVMIARGDLAIEVGYERLAELQEELLWLCEAAHTPVIWATQVLERLVKKGSRSRAEVTDAAMGVRAECVMLNKGPNVLAGVRILDDVLRRMQAHQQKKTPTLRALRAWER